MNLPTVLQSTSLALAIRPEAFCVAMESDEAGGTVFSVISERNLVVEPENAIEQMLVEVCPFLDGRAERCSLRHVGGFLTLGISPRYAVRADIDRAIARLDRNPSCAYLDEDECDCSGPACRYGW